MDKTDILKKFGSHIKKIRQSQHLTQVDVSSAMHRDQQSLQRVESGNVNPSLIYILELAKALGIQPAEIVNFHD